MSPNTGRKTKGSTSRKPPQLQLPTRIQPRRIASSSNLQTLSPTTVTLPLPSHKPEAISATITKDDRKRAREGSAGGLSVGKIAKKLAKELKRSAGQLEGARKVAGFKVEGLSVARERERAIDSIL